MITAIVLAAGESRRMGHVNKLLLPLGEATLIERVVGAVCQSEADEVIVVLGHEARRIRAALDGHDVLFAENDRSAGLRPQRLGLQRLDQRLGAKLSLRALEGARLDGCICHNVLIL